MTSIQLTIDNREHKLINLLSTKFHHIKHDVAVLDIGDVKINITCMTGNEKSQRVITFERKTLEDLEASVKDGRFHEQKKRALGNGIDLTYIIEGSFVYDREAENKSSSAKMQTGCIINTLIRDRIPIVFTKDLDETANFIECLMSRLASDPGKYIVPKQESNEDKDSYIGTICLKKKDNIDMNTCFMLQLTCIPGISKTKAQSIVTHHTDIKNMNDLIRKLAGQKPEKFFKDTPGIGKGIAKAIYSFCGIAM